MASVSIDGSDYSDISKAFPALSWVAFPILSWVLSWVCIPALGSLANLVHCTTLSKVYHARLESVSVRLRCDTTRAACLPQLRVLLAQGEKYYNLT